MSKTKNKNVVLRSKNEVRRLEATGVETDETLHLDVVLFRALLNQWLPPTPVTTPTKIDNKQI